MNNYLSNWFVINIILLLSFFSLSAQDEPFRGGSGDGFAIDTLNLGFSDFCVGGIGDGFSKFVLVDIFSDYTKGGIGDGFSTLVFDNQFFDFTSGGLGDGYCKNEIAVTFHDFTRGGASDGFSFDTIQNTINAVFLGGESDGFAYNKYGHIIYWTGAVGTGWNVAGNWENGLLPTHCNPVVIPAGAPNFPAVNAGLLRIGYYKNEGDYKCARIKINTGAEMTTRVNCFVENYNLIFIHGTFFVKNPASNAFINQWKGMVQLKPNASLVFKE